MPDEPVRVAVIDSGVSVTHPQIGPVADGVAITASIHAAPDTAALLRRLMRERGLPVPEPTLGVAK